MGDPPHAATGAEAHDAIHQPIVEIGTDNGRDRMSATCEATINRYYRAINEADWGVYNELFTPDALLEAPGGVTAAGPAGMQAFDQVWKRAAADFTVTPLHQVSTEEMVLSENLAEGTQTDVLSTPSGDLPPTGRRFGGKYVGVFELRDGKIAAQRIYFDRLIIVEQLGAPEPAMSTGATMRR
jgi:ketosteroid isomerase-like protein